MIIPETYTYEEAQARFRCDRQPIRRAVLAGLIVSYKPGRTVLLDADSANAWFLSTQQVPTGGAIRRPRRKKK